MSKQRPNEDEGDTFPKGGDLYTEKMFIEPLLWEKNELNDKENIK